MAGFNGSGTFVRLHNWSNDAAAGLNISSSKMDGEDDGFATGLSTCVTKDGQTTTTAQIPFAQGINVSGGTTTFSGTTIADLGTVTTADINGGTVDGTVIGGASAAAGTFTTFTSNGIDDNATAEKVDITDTIVDVLTGANIRAVDGILFGSDTAAANMLDDYEEGTFTPELWDSSNSGAEGQTYSVQAGRYTKIGDRVFFNLRIVVTGLGTLTAGDSARIGGLPFTANATANTQSGGAVLNGGGLNITAGYNITTYADTGTNYLLLPIWDSATGTTLATVGEISASGSLIISGHYGV